MLARQFGSANHVHNNNPVLLHTSVGVLNVGERHVSFGWLFANMYGHAKSFGKE